MKRVISLWLPKFATDRLCRLRQDWLDSPLGMIHETGGQLLLHAANHTAEQAGIRAGMTLADAFAILPDLKTSEADIPAETKSLSRLADWCGRYTPWTAPDEEGSGAAFAGGGSIWLDVTGCAHLFGGEEALMRDIIDRLNGLGFTAYAAIADTPGQPGQPPVTPAISAAVGLPFVKDRHRTFLQCFLSPDFGWRTIPSPVFRLSACAGSATLCRSRALPLQIVLAATSPIVWIRLSAIGPNRYLRLRQPALGMHASVLRNRSEDWKTLPTRYATLPTILPPCSKTTVSAPAGLR